MTGSHALDTIIQAAAVELFQFYGVAVAPQPRSTVGHKGPFPDTSAQISFNSKPLKGSLSLSVPDDLLASMRGESTQAHQSRDFVRELTNQLMGRVKGRLIPFQVLLDIGLPALVNADLLRRNLSESASARLFVFRTLRGNVLAAMDGNLDQLQLRYSGKGEHGSEGDVILF